MPNVKVKPIADGIANIELAASTVGSKYSKGIDTGRAWQPAAGSESAESLYAVKTQEAIASKRRQKVIQSRSEEDWRGPSKAKGATNIGPAMRLAKDKWGKAFQPYKTALEGVNIAERGADAMQNIDGRLKPIVQAMIDTKKSIKG